MLPPRPTWHRRLWASACGAVVALSTWGALAAAPRTSLDPGLQAAARRLLAEARPVLGGIVALHVPTGRVLA